jgi:hypothetical protein
VVVAATGAHAIGAESVPDKAAFFALPSIQGKGHPAAGGATEVGALGAPNMENRIKEQEAARNGQTQGDLQRHEFWKKQGKES